MIRINMLTPQKQWGGHDNGFKTIFSCPKDAVVKESYVSGILPKGPIFIIHVKTGSKKEPGYYNLKKVHLIEEGKDN